MLVRSSWRLGAGMILLLLAAACSDDALGPADLADPVALQAELGAADSAFDSEAFTSFSAVTGHLGPTPAAPVVPWLSASVAALPRSTSALYGPAALRAPVLQRLGASLASSPARGPIIDNSLYGRVYRWDDVSDQYSWDGVETVSGLNGVRFILYRVDELGNVIEPEVEVGFVDLVDASTTASVRLQITVRGTGGTPTYVTYTATATPSASGVELTVTGSLTNGQPGAANKTLTFDLGIEASQSAVTVEVRFALNNPAITVELRETVSITETGLVLTIDFRVIRAGEVVRLLGRIEVDGEVIEVSFEVRVNGGRVASLSGDLESAQWVDAGGDPLGLDDLDALDRLGEAFQAFDRATNSLLLPLLTMMAN